MIDRIRHGLRQFRDDDSGAVVIDYIPVFFLLIVLVLIVFEIGMAYFQTLSTQKAVQLGARVAAVIPPIHTSVPLTNARANPMGRMGLPCLNPGQADRCVNPGGPWVCRGADIASGGGGGGCNTARFNIVVENMRRVFPQIEAKAVTVTYIYRRLGETGGPFVPEINVALVSHNYPFVIFGFSPVRHGAVSASAFGEDMTPEFFIISSSSTGIPPGIGG